MLRCFYLITIFFHYHLNNELSFIWVYTFHSLAGLLACSIPHSMVPNAACHARAQLSDFYMNVHCAQRMVYVVYDMCPRLPVYLDLTSTALLLLWFSSAKETYNNFLEWCFDDSSSYLLNGQFKSLWPVLMDPLAVIKVGRYKTQTHTQSFLRMWCGFKNEWVLIYMRCWTGRSYRGKLSF